jgi:tetratricopeptide (TPR) repeat protein
MSNRSFALTLGATLSAAVIVASSLAFAAGTAPAPTPAPTTAAPQKDCSKFTKDSTKWKNCIKAGGHAMNNEDLYANGYKLAKAGDYTGALEFLTAVTDQKDVRVLTLIGYSTRKLGKIDEGMVFYAKALELDPNAVNTREYLGEAYLQKKDLPSAQAQLVEIANRCGKTCEPYTELNDAIGKFQAGAL